MPKPPKPPKPGPVRASISASPTTLVPPGDVILAWNAGSTIVKPYLIRVSGPGLATETPVAPTGAMSVHCEMTGIYQFDLVNASGYVVASCSVDAASGS